MSLEDPLVVFTDSYVIGRMVPPVGFISRISRLTNFT